MIHDWYSSLHWYKYRSDIMKVARFLSHAKLPSGHKGTRCCDNIETMSMLSQHRVSFNFQFQRIECVVTIVRCLMSFRWLSMKILFWLYSFNKWGTSMTKPHDAKFKYYPMKFESFVFLIIVGQLTKFLFSK